MPAKRRLYLKPKRAGHVVRDPKTTRKLPDAGSHVPDTTFWRRRLRSGDVVEAKPPAPKPKAAPAAKETEKTAPVTAPKAGDS